MRHLWIAVAAVGLTVGLTACPGPVDDPPVVDAGTNNNNNNNNNNNDAGVKTDAGTDAGMNMQTGAGSFTSTGDLALTVADGVFQPVYDGSTFFALTSDTASKLGLCKGEIPENPSLLAYVADTTTGSYTVASEAATLVYSKGDGTVANATEGSIDVTAATATTLAGAFEITAAADGNMVAVSGTHSGTFNVTNVCPSFTGTGSNTANGQLGFQPAGGSFYFDPDFGSYDMWLSNASDTEAYACEAAVTARTEGVWVYFEPADLDNPAGTYTDPVATGVQYWLEDADGVISRYLSDEVVTVTVNSGSTATNLTGTYSATVLHRTLGTTVNLSGAFSVTACP